MIKVSKYQQCLFSKRKYKANPGFLKIDLNKQIDFLILPF